ncbi:MAG: condensation domain-containing protein [Planctomycetaceae bacterium]
MPFGNAWLGASVTIMFPLPLSDFEYYMLVDDRPSHPMVFVMAAQLSGAFQQSALQQALEELIQCHPFLNCCVTEIPGRGWCWQPLTILASTAPPAGRLDWKDGDEASVSGFVPQVRSIDLTSEAGLQVVVRASPNQARLILYIHHVCCDGIGGIQILGELLARYGQKTASADAKRPAFDEPRKELLLERENYDSSDATVERQKKSLKKTVGKISRLLLRKPVTLAPSVVSVALPSAAAKTSAPAILEAVIPKASHRNLRDVAAAHDVSINDLFIGQFLLHIRRWNSRTRPDHGKSWIRLSVPVSMRTRVHDQMPVANVVSYAFVTRRQLECDDMDALLKSIHRQTGDVVFNREGIVCLKIFKFLRKFPRGMKMFLGLKSCLSTAVLANIGDIRRRYSGRFPLNNGKWIAGNVLVERLTGVAPVRPNTRAAVSIGEYAGELSISLRTDAAMISVPDSQRFLDEFVEALERLASEVSDVGYGQATCNTQPD